MNLSRAFAPGGESNFDQTWNTNTRAVRFSLSRRHCIVASSGRPPKAKVTEKGKKNERRENVLRSIAEMALQKKIYLTPHSRGFLTFLGSLHLLFRPILTYLSGYATVTSSLPNSQFQYRASGTPSKFQTQQQGGAKWHRSQQPDGGPFYLRQSGAGQWAAFRLTMRRM